MDVNSERFSFSTMAKPATLPTLTNPTPPQTITIEWVSSSLTANSAVTISRNGCLVEAIFDGLDMKNTECLYGFIDITQDFRPTENMAFTVISGTREIEYLTIRPTGVLVCSAKNGFKEFAASWVHE